jgi:hypothetical protein
MLSNLRRWVSGDNLHGSFNRDRQLRTSGSSSEVADTVNPRGQVKFTGDGRTRRGSAAVGMRTQ